MKTININLYSFSELSEEAQKKVIEREQTKQRCDPDNPCLDEAIESLKQIIEALNLSLIDYDIGPYSRSCYIKASDLFGGDIAEWDANDSPLQRLEKLLEEKGYTWDNKGNFTFPGVCGFTGVGYDDDIAEKLYTELRFGESMHTALNAVAKLIQSQNESELEEKLEEVESDLRNDPAERYTEAGDFMAI